MCLFMCVCEREIASEWVCVRVYFEDRNNQQHSHKCVCTWMVDVCVCACVRVCAKTGKNISMNLNVYVRGCMYSCVCG